VRDEREGKGKERERERERGRERERERKRKREKEKQRTNACDPALVEGGGSKEDVKDGEEHEKTVANVSKHHTKEKGKGDDGKGRRVCFLIASHSVHVDDVLEGSGERVCGLIGRWRSLVGEETQNGGCDCSCSIRATAEGVTDDIDGIRRDPSLSNQALSSDVVIKHVESVVDALFLEGVLLPLRRGNTSRNDVSEAWTKRKEKQREREVKRETLSWRMRMAERT